MIAERNIFNPNRSPRTSRADRESRPSTAPEIVTLVGTLSYEKGSYAFFDGSRPEWTKVVELGQTIADHKLVAIGNDTVTMQVKTNTFQLEVGGRLRRRENGWEAVGGVVPPVRTTNAESSAASGGDESDVIKRLMQQREKELNNAE